MKHEEIDWIEPATLLKRLAAEPWTQLLGGVEKTDHAVWSRGWSILVSNPVRRLEVRKGTALVDGRPVSGNPWDIFKEQIWARRFRRGSREIEGLGDPGFHSGAVGFAAYEMARWCQPTLPVFESSDETDLAFGFYDAAVCFHHDSRRAFVTGRRKSAVAKLKAKIESAIGVGSLPGTLTGFQWGVDEEPYKKGVASLIDHIRRGDIFQANLTMPVTAQFAKDSSEQILAAELFAEWSRESDAPFAAALLLDTCAVVSNSPENFFQVQRQGKKYQVICDPIKGTAPRFDDAVKDRLAAEALTRSEKDRAENIMIVDLVRSDLSRGCTDDSVKVEQLCALQSFKRVHHLASRVTGTLQCGKTAIDILGQCFPCGSVTGAPKEKAMELLRSYESGPRGVYCGAIGYLDDGGEAAFSVPIRTAVVKKENGGISARYGAGGGVTLLSDPQAEYEEVKIKAKGFEDLCLGSSKGVNE